MRNLERYIEACYSIIHFDHSGCIKNWEKIEHVMKERVKKNVTTKQLVAINFCKILAIQLHSVKFTDEETNPKIIPTHSRTLNHL